MHVYMDTATVYKIVVEFNMIKCRKIATVDCLN